LPDIWEIAHDSTLGAGDSLDNFSGGPVTQAVSMGSIPTTVNAVINPFAPRGESWVSGGVNDWDGDGISNRDEYLAWYNNLTDNNGISYDPTVINMGQPNVGDGSGNTNTGSSTDQALQSLDLISGYLKIAKKPWPKKPKGSSKKKLKKYKKKKKNIGQAHKDLKAEVGQLQQLAASSESEVQAAYVNFTVANVDTLLSYVKKAIKKKRNRAKAKKAWRKVTAQLNLLQQV